MTLSIIIPAYNAEPYIDELINVLKPQITEEVEVIIVDDGSRMPYLAPYDWVNVCRQENAGVSAARNKGLDKAAGEYIAFIDADDLVSPNYISAILNKIKKEQFDYCYLSWDSFGVWKQEVKIRSVKDKFPAWNLCVWNRVYKRELIGDTRFNLKKLIAEDAEFIRNIEKGKKSFISEIVYHYRSDTPNSLTKRFNNGKLDTKRIVYYYPEVKKDMTFLIDEFKEADKDVEVILLTNNNCIPELSNYAMVMKPKNIKGTELRGKKCSFFTKLELPLAADVILYMTNGHNIGGIETFIYNFCLFLSKTYKIIVIFDNYDKDQLSRLSKLVRCERHTSKIKGQCKTLIINRITDNIPSGIQYDRVIQMVHTCEMGRYIVPDGRDETVFVSAAAQKSFNKPGKIIHNLVNVTDKKEPILLISATRLTYEKGEDRMIALARKLRELDIPYVWMIFTSGKFKRTEPGMVFMEPTLDIGPFIQKADYLVQLSDVESFCYTIAESLMLGTPVITTPIDVLPELNVVDGENAYVLPFDIDSCEDLNKIYDRPLKFKYNYDNQNIIDEWKQLLDQEHLNNKVTVSVIKPFNDLQLQKHVSLGKKYEVSRERAAELVKAGYCIIV